MRTRTNHRSFAIGLFSGLALAGAGALMLGAANNQGGAPVYDYYVTNGDQAGSTAKLWRREVTKATLEYVGQFNASARGR